MTGESLAERRRASEYDADLALLRFDCGDRPARGGGAGAAGSVVVGQLGQSLDGRIATPSGASKYINGVEALCHLHRLRARCDAVIVGIGTAIADDPQLTTRHVPGPNPVRVVIDPRGRMPSALGMLADGAGPVLAIGCPGTRGPAGAERIELPCGAEGHISPEAIIEALAARGLRRILVEGGAETLARFIDAGAVDELHLMVAPILLGSGKTGLNLAPIETLAEAMRPAVRTMRFGDGDLLCICEFERAVSEAARRATG